MNDLPVKIKTKTHSCGCARVKKQLEEIRRCIPYQLQLLKNVDSILRLLYGNKNQPGWILDHLHCSLQDNICASIFLPKMSLFICIYSNSVSIDKWLMMTSHFKKTFLFIGTKEHQDLFKFLFECVLQQCD